MNRLDELRPVCRIRFVYLCRITVCLLVFLDSLIAQSRSILRFYGSHWDCIVSIQKVPDVQPVRKVPVQVLMGNIDFLLWPRSLDEK